MAAVAPLSGRGSKSSKSKKKIIKVNKEEGCIFGINISVQSHLIGRSLQRHLLVWSSCRLKKVLQLYWIIKEVLFMPFGYFYSRRVD